MPDVQKLRIGFSAANNPAHSGVFLAPLIGMDPAANDWLHSPDETGLGDFGVLMMLASSPPHFSEQNSASHLLCKTIRRLFDQTIDLPQDDNSLIALLENYLIRAHQHICELPDTIMHQADKFSSAALGLIRQEKLYLVWVGDIKWYRFNPRGTSGSYFTADPRWQMLTVDHAEYAEHALTHLDSQPFYQVGGLKQQLGFQQSPPICSKYIVPLFQGDILVCTQDYLQNNPGEAKMIQLFQEGIDAQSFAGQLQYQLQLSRPDSNHATMVVEIIEAPINPGFIVKDNKTLLEEAIQLYGLPLTSIPAKQNTGEKRKLLAFNKPKSQNTENEIEPMRVRTVLPFDDVAPEIPNVLIATTSTVVPMKQPPSEVSVPEDELSEPMNNPTETSNSKLRIRFTVYPDTEETESAPEKSEPVMLGESSQPSLLDVVEEENDFQPVDPEIEGETGEESPVTGEIKAEPVDVPVEQYNPEEEEVPAIAELDFGSSFSTFDNTSDTEEDGSLSDVADVSVAKSDPDLHAETGFIPAEKQESSQSSEVDKNNQLNSESADLEDNDSDTTEEGLDSQGSENLFESSESRTNEESSLPHAEGEVLKGYSSFRRWVWIAGIVLLIGIFWYFTSGYDPEKLAPPQKKGDGIEQTPKGKQKPNGETDRPKDETTADVAQSPVSKEKDNPNDTKGAVKKEEKKKTPTLDTEPEYDAAIQQNKLQLLDEVNTLWAQKKTLCRKISSYRNNAPSRKQDKLDPLVYDCEQLEEKFSSIFDPKSGYFRTTRYDFLTGTLNNIKVSLNRTENRLDEIRQE